MKGIQGLKYWSELKRYCNQNNNVVEKVRRVALLEANMNDLEKLLAAGFSGPTRVKIKKVMDNNRKKYRKWWYKETCSLESIYIALDCMGELEMDIPEWKRIDITPSAFMAMHINWSKYDKDYQEGDAMDNRYIYSLAKMLTKMGYKTVIITDPKPLSFRHHLPLNHGAILHIPGHYSTAIAWDFDRKRLIWHNVNPDDRRNKNGGKFEIMKESSWGKIPLEHVLFFWKI